MISFDNTEKAFASKDNKELKNAKFLFSILNNPSLSTAGKHLTNLAFSLRVPINSIIKNTIYKQFVGGESIEECKPVINKLAESGIGTILDYSIEGMTEEEQFDQTTDELLRVIEFAKNNPKIPFTVFKPTGIGKFELYEKLNNPSNKLSEADVKSIQKMHARFDKLCKASLEIDKPILIDAEESWIQDAIDRIVESLMAKYNKEKAIVFNTLQMYRHDRLDYLNALIEKGKKNNFKVGVKFVRGAYMEKERGRAEEKGYPSPINPNKEATDTLYNKAIETAFNHLEELSFCNASHNEKSALLLVDLMEKNKIENNNPQIFFAQLYGMSDHISFNLSSAGYNVAKYVPYGPVREVMPYLLRRAEENTSVAGQTGRELTLLNKEVKRRGL